MPQYPRSLSTRRQAIHLSPPQRQPDSADKPIGQIMLYDSSFLMIMIHSPLRPAIGAQ